MKSRLETVVFGGGCFWCTEAVFQRLRGVQSVTSGYAGGTGEEPTYARVSQGASGHVEVIQIEYDSSVISFDDLLAVFFHVHDPTQVNRQGNDVGEEYRSVIFYTTDSQKQSAEKLIQELTESHAYDKPIVTELEPLQKFYEAENYHKDYYNRNTDAPYCELVIAPKLEKLQNKFASLLK